MHVCWKKNKLLQPMYTIQCNYIKLLTPVEASWALWRVELRTSVHPRVSFSMVNLSHDSISKYAVCQMEQPAHPGDLFLYWEFTPEISGSCLAKLKTKTLGWFLMEQRGNGLWWISRGGVRGRVHHHLFFWSGYRAHGTYGTTMKLECIRIKRMFERAVAVDF